MTSRLVSLLAIAALCGSRANLFADDATSGGTLTVQDKTYPLKHALAYETTIDDEPVIVVALTGQKITAEKLKEVREEEKDGHVGSFNRPYLKLQFNKAG